jgi:antitoxin component of MazEF toxin-antitoxin module
MPEVSDLDRRHMDELTAEVRTKSDKIRCLRAAGYERGDIARYLGVRYQFVYNVDTAPQSKGKQLPLHSPREAAGSEAADESVAALEPAPNWVWAVIRKGGTIQLPAEFLEAMGAAEGDQVQLALDRGVVRVLSRAAAIRELQDQVRRYVPAGVSLVDELLAERRSEAAREERAATDD